MGTGVADPVLLFNFKARIFPFSLKEKKSEQKACGDFSSEGWGKIKNKRFQKWNAFSERLSNLSFSDYGLLICFSNLVYLHIFSPWKNSQVSTLGVAIVGING